MHTKIFLSLTVFVATVTGVAVGQEASPTATPLRKPGDLSLGTQSPEADPSLIDVADESAPVEINEERYEDGRIKVRREVTLDLAGNYIKHGTWKGYDFTGAEVATGEFQNNRREGQWSKVVNWGDAELLNQLPYTEYEAPFVSSAEFKGGKLDGPWTIKDKEGRLVSEWHYSDGQLTGTAKWYFPDGSPREEIQYSNGLLDGNYKMWDQEGTELMNDTYQEGRKLASQQELHSNGTLKWEGMFLHETYVVKTADDWWNTKPVVYEKTGKPERHGRFTSWYESGQKKFEGVFEHEIRAGEFSWWHENTQQAVRGSFKENKRHGVWVWWHENGQKAIQGQYEMGKLTGRWSYWSAAGKLERKVNYDGEPETVAIHAVPSDAIPVIADRRADATDGTKLK